MGDVSNVHGFNPNRGIMDFVEHPLDSFRDSKIKRFFSMIGLNVSALSSDQKLYSDEVPQNDNPRANLLAQAFKPEKAKFFVTGKDENGTAYMTPDDVKNFIEATDYGAMFKASNINLAQAKQFEQAGIDDPFVNNNK